MEKQTISAELEVTGESTFNKNINVKGKIQENGNDLLPSGAIIMWYGNKIPNGWKICNGNESTPDLRGRFILGVSDNKKNKISMGSMWNS